MGGQAEGMVGSAAPSAGSVLLVHGAWHGSWCWQQVLEILPTADAVDLPSAGGEATFAEDVLVVRRRLRELPGPVLLCGHSYGGAVISEASSDPHVQGVMFVCGFALLAGESVNDNAPRAAAIAAGERRGRLAGALLTRDGARAIEVEPAGAIPGLYRDCRPEVAQAAVARLVPHATAPFSSKVTSSGWLTKESRYVVCRNDEAVQPFVQRLFAKRCRSSVELESSHSPMLSMPGVVAAEIQAMQNRMTSLS